MSNLERYKPSLSGRIRYEHFHRYAFATDFVADKVVLDIACGEGYGSAVLSRFARSVTGVDIDEEVIAAANRRYGRSKQLEYIVGNANAIPSSDHFFDVVVSLETIEHLSDPDALLREIRRVLKPGGLLIVSSPNKIVYNRYKSEPNEYHINEFEIGEFSRIISNYFANIALFSQRMILASALGPAATQAVYGNDAQYRGFTAELSDTEAPQIGPGVTRLGFPEYLIAVASDKEIPVPTTRDSVFLMRTDDLWEEHVGIMNWASGLHKEDEALRARIREFEGMLGNQERAHELVLAEARLEHMRELNAARDTAHQREIQHLSQRSATANFSLLAPLLHVVTGAPVESDPQSIIYTFTRIAIRIGAQDQRIADLEAQKSAQAADRESLQILARDTAHRATALEAELRRTVAEHEDALGAERQRVVVLEAEWRAEAETLRKTIQEWDTKITLARSAVHRAQNSIPARRMGPPASELKDLREAYVLAASEHRRYIDQLTRAREAFRPHSPSDRVQIQLTVTKAKFAAFRESGLFVADYYARAAGLADVEAAWSDFCARGCVAGIDCNPLLSTNWMAKQNPELAGYSASFVAVAALGIYDANMHPLFDPTYYADANGLALQIDSSSLVHYMAHGRAGGLSPHPLIDCDWLRNEQADAGPFDLVRYVTDPSWYRLPVHQLFDPVYYLDSNSDVAAGNVNPLMHYLEHGWRENRAPNQLFDNLWYLFVNPDVVEAGMVPLVHYAQYGAVENRNPHPLFDPIFYNQKYLDVVAANYPPYAHFLQHGWSEGRLSYPPAAAITRKCPSWPPARIIDEIRSGRTDLSVLGAELNALEALPIWGRSSGQGFYLNQKLRDYIIDRYGEACIDLYVRLFSIIDRYEHNTEAFDCGNDIEPIVSDITKLSAEHMSISPIVSIIIPVHNKLVYTLTCLLSIINASSTHSFEIIVADDVSSDRTAEIIRCIGGCVRLIRHNDNIGFLRNCNTAAESAVGQYIVLLNNDTIVFPGWLDELITPLKTNLSIGLTGSKLLNGDGTLQEAGGVFWRDGSAWNFGRDQEPWLPEFNYAKDVDYVSGASMALPLTLWKTLGGFDPVFAPAYCEDSDLAFRVRALGYRTRYQPHSMLVHHEGRSHGRELTSGIKAYQTINNAKLLERWRSTLDRENFDNGQSVFLARDRSRTKPHILVVDHYVPQWDRDAGSRTMFTYIKLFAESGFAVTFWSDNLDEDREYARTLQQMGVEVIYSLAYKDRFPQWIEENGKYLDYAFLSRPHITEKYISDVSKFSNIKKIYYGHDLHFRRILLEHAIKGGDGLLAEAAQYEEIETRICSLSDVVLYPSQEEIALILDRVPRRVTAFAIPMVVLSEAELAAGEAHIASNERVDPFKLMFVGGFAHHPNLDGILWFVRHVMPLIRHADARFHLTIAGSNTPDAVYDLVGEGIAVLGKISDAALFDLYCTSSLAVVPLRYGGGVKGKVIEAMARGVPVAMTGIGAQGIPDADRLGFVGDTPEVLAAAIVRAVRDPTAALTQAGRAIEFLRANYSMHAARRLLAHVMPELSDAPLVSTRKNGSKL